MRWSIHAIVTGMVGEVCLIPTAQEIDMKLNERNSSLLLRFMLMLVFAAVGLLQPGTIQAQWTTPDASQNISNTNTGNVGIGTSTPGTLLDVSGNVLNLGSESGTKNRGNNTTKLARLAMPPYTTANLRFSLLGGATTSTANIVALGGEVGGMASATQIDFFTAATTNVDTGTLRMTITGAGNVGIGTSAPDVKFHVHHSSTNTNLGNIQLADLGFALRNTSSTNGNMSLISFQDAGGFGNAQFGAIQTDQTNHKADLVFFTRDALAFGERLRIKSDGTIGIGTASPTTAFHLNSAAAAYSSNGQLLITDSGNTNRHLRLGYDSTLEAGWIQATKVGTSSEPLLLNPNGANVGIGTTAPSAKLHVAGDGRIAGNLTVDGNIAAKYQDVAEWVPATHALAPGTVVTLSRARSNLVEASAKAYDTRVAGVVSEEPGIALGEKGENKVLVATTGRVRIKVDATNAPIEIGDLLVTSEKEGVAMKSIPVEMGGIQIHRPGTIVGKALERLDHGTGEILVLLSLQ